MKMMKIIQITAIIFVLICLYEIYMLSGTLSWSAGRPLHQSTGNISLFIIFELIAFICGIVIGGGLYYGKSWSRSPMLGYAAFLLFLSSISLLSFLLNITNINKIPADRLLYFVIFTVRDILLFSFSLWCSYYLHREDVKTQFCKT